LFENLIQGILLSQMKVWCYVSDFDSVVKNTSSRIMMFCKAINLIIYPIYIFIMQCCNIHKVQYIIIYKVIFHQKYV